MDLFIKGLGLKASEMAKAYFLTKIIIPIIKVNGNRIENREKEF